MKKFIVEQSLETIRNRVDSSASPNRDHAPGEDGSLSSTGVKDPSRPKNLIGKTALLEFKLLDEEHSLDEALKGNVPEGSVVLHGYRVEPESGRRTDVPYLVRSKTLMTGGALENAQVKISDRFGAAYVGIKFNSQGAIEFERITGENVKETRHRAGRRRVHSAPVIQEKISGGQAQIREPSPWTRPRTWPSSSGRGTAGAGRSFWKSGPWDLPGPGFHHKGLGPSPSAASW